MPDNHSPAGAERDGRAATLAPPLPNAANAAASGTAASTPGAERGTEAGQPGGAERIFADVAPRAPRPDRGSLPLTRLPEPRQILAWIYAGRLSVATAIFISVAWVWQQASPFVTLSATLLLVASLGFTASSFWFTHLLNRAPGHNFVYSQTIYDVLLVTSIVHLTGGPESNFAPLYILVICAAAILLPFLGGMLIALLASALYAAEVAWNSHGGMSGGLLLQLGLFTVVALVTGYVGDRLRQTGAALDEVETELELLRLDTDEILGTVNTGILTVDSHHRLAYMNRAAAEMLSLDAEEWLGKPVLEELNHSAPGLGWVIARSQRERRPIVRFETGDRLQGSFVLGVSTTLLDRPGEGAPPITAIFQNITEKRRVERLERRAERLEAIAQLSASLAHEIKNPLASIRSAVEQLAHPATDHDDRQVLNDLVVRESSRLSRLLAEFIDFARVKVTSPATLDLAALVEDAVALVRAHPDADGRAIQVRHRASGSSLHVRGDEDLLHRAVANLILNAVQWAGEGGRVRVTLDLTRSEMLSSELGVREVVRLRVADSGPGIDPGVADHIFNPFFTLRPGGTGLGLALVQRAAEAHGGVVFVEDGHLAETRGAVLAFCLPTLSAAEPSASLPERLARSEI